MPTTTDGVRAVAERDVRWVRALGACEPSAPSKASNGKLGSPEPYYFKSDAGLLREKTATSGESMPNLQEPDTGESGVSGLSPATA